MAIVSLIALLVALATGATIALQPWAETTVSPRLGLAPGLGVDLDEATPAEGGAGPALARARPAAGDGGPALAAPESAGGSAQDRPRLALASARPVSREPRAPLPQAPQPVAEPAPDPAPAPPSEPEPVPVSVPTPAPAATPAPGSPDPAPSGLGSHPPRPSTAAIGEVDGDAGEEEPAAEGEEPAVEGERGEGEEGEAEDEAPEEDECAPPLSFFHEGAPHEVVLCVAVSGDLYLLLDGERLEVALP